MFDDVDPIAGSSAIPDTTVELPIQETTPAETQTTQPEPEAQPEPKPAWQTRHRTPDEVFEANRKLQSERDRLQAEYDALRRQANPPKATAPDPQVQAEQFLNKFVTNPMEALQEIMQGQITPIVGKLMWQEFKESHPDADAYRKTMGELVEKNPAFATNSETMEALYAYVKAQDLSAKAQEAQRQVDENRAKIEQSKKTDAFVEGATQPKRSAPPTLKPGMSVEESEKALDAMGIGTVKEY